MLHQLRARRQGRSKEMHCAVGGIDGAAHVDWYETNELKIGDELRVRLISSDIPDPATSIKNCSSWKAGLDQEAQRFRLMS